MNDQLDINSAFQIWATTYEIEIIASNEICGDYEDELMDSIYYSLFDDDNEAVKGLVASEQTFELEFGTSPRSYLPDSIDDALDLLEQAPWSLAELDTKDDWYTAQVVLKHSSGEKYNFVIEGINNRDWVPYDLFFKLEQFSRNNCSRTLMPIYVDAFYRMIALPHQAAKELTQLIEKFSTPY